MTDQNSVFLARHEANLAAMSSKQRTELDEIKAMLLAQPHNSGRENEKPKSEVQESIEKVCTDLGGLAKRTTPGVQGLDSAPTDGPWYPSEAVKDEAHKCATHSGFVLRYATEDGLLEVSDGTDTWKIHRGHGNHIFLNDRNGNGEILYNGKEFILGGDSLPSALLSNCLGLVKAFHRQWCRWKPCDTRIGGRVTVTTNVRECPKSDVTRRLDSTHAPKQRHAFVMTPNAQECFQSIPLIGPKSMVKMTFTPRKRPRLTIQGQYWYAYLGKGQNFQGIRWKRFHNNELSMSEAYISVQRDGTCDLEGDSGLPADQILGMVKLACAWLQNQDQLEELRHQEQG